MHADPVILSAFVLQQSRAALEEEFGIERLISSLAETGACSTAEQVAQNIVRAIREYAGEKACAECSDDRTIVVLRVLSE